MKVAKRVGIWMNHSTAQVIEFSDSKSEVLTIESKFTHEEGEKSLTKGEKHMIPVFTSVAIKSYISSFFSCGGYC
jgi:hypothetical protein